MRTNGKPNLAHFQDGMDHPTSDAGAIVQAGGTLQQTATSYSTAVTVQRPREKKSVLSAVVEEAGLCGEGFFYSWTVNDRSSKTGKSLVEGVSIDGAMIMARNWGNCAVPIGLVQDAPQHWVLSADFVDLETGFNVRRLFRQRKSQSAGKMDAERSLDIAFQIGQSKAQRNVILKAMPEWLVTQALDAAKATAEAKYEDVPKHAPKFVATFKKLGVTQEQLEAKLGYPMADWQPRDLVALAAIGRAIKDRQTTVANEFPEPEAEPAKPAAASAAAPPREVKADADGVIEGEFHEIEGDDGEGPGASMREPGED